VKAIDAPSVQTKLKKIGADIVAPERRSSGYLADFLRNEIRKWQTAIAAAKMPMQ
jgi:hypothetical protein